jgi:glutaredoxin-like YruB-family protein
VSNPHRLAARLAPALLALLVAGCSASEDASPTREAADAPADAGGDVIGAVAHALGADDEEQEPDAGPGYWRYTEANGSLRFVQSFAEVPASARATAERISTAAPRTAARPARAAPRRPARPLPAAQEEPARRTDATVVVYTTSWCPWCRKTLAWLDERGVDYENRDIESNPAWAQELQRKTGRRSIPVVDVDGRIVRGFDPGTLEELL